MQDILQICSESYFDFLQLICSLQNHSLKRYLNIGAFNGKDI